MAILDTSCGPGEAVHDVQQGGAGCALSGRGRVCRREGLQSAAQAENTHQAAWCSLWRLCVQHCSSTCAGVGARPQLPDRHRHGHMQAPHLRSSRSEAPSPHSVRTATSSKRTTNWVQVRCGPARIAPSISRTMGPLPTYPAWCTDPQSAAWTRVCSQESVARHRTGASGWPWSGHHQPDRAC